MEKELTFMLLGAALCFMLLLVLFIENYVKSHRRKLMKELRKKFVLRQASKLREIINGMSYIEVKEELKELSFDIVSDKISRFLSPRPCVSQ